VKAPSIRPTTVMPPTNNHRVRPRDIAPALAKPASGIVAIRPNKGLPSSRDTSILPAALRYQDAQDR
jgi:hypothetical protein